ncbi:MAG: sigma-70 family RNA polymerase sigma factor [Bacteroidota bacterium]
MPPDDLAHLDAVARHLPFDLLDVEAANVAFARWRESGDADHQRDVDLWTYCYAHRYFLIKFVRERGAPSDLDACISKTLTRIRRHYDEIDPQHFASYVAVACRNALLNHRRDRRGEAELPEQLPGQDDPQHTTDLDSRLVRQVVAAALADLPRTISEVGRLRLLDGREYADIADQLNAPLPTIRTYASRAMAGLRADPRIRALYFEDLFPPGALPDETTSARVTTREDRR